MKKKRLLLKLELKIYWIKKTTLKHLMWFKQPSKLILQNNFHHGVEMRLFIVSNRLPVTLISPAPQPKYYPTLGGLATGLNSFVQHFKGEMQKEVIWFGWPGISVAPEHTINIRKSLSSLNCEPIFLPDSLKEAYYDGFCNGILWPLLHGFTDHNKTIETKFWEAYKHTNYLFCKALGAIIQPEDQIWIHDYHLFLLPKLLRTRFPKLAIAFFLHTPFPSLKDWNKLSGVYRSTMLHGLLGADLIGFHIQEYTDFFIECCANNLKIKVNNQYLAQKERLIKVVTSPMGIDYDFFHEKAKRYHSIEQNLETKIILSVDRLDYSKGILQKLKAFHDFLTNHPEWYYKVIFKLVVAPSRQNLEEYRDLKTLINEHVEQINRDFSTLSWIPVHYQYKKFTLEQLIKFYATSEIALVTPIKDGLNLVAKEYIASRKDSGGIILSNSAGSAHELSGAILVDPKNIKAISNAIEETLTLDSQLQHRKILNMKKHLQEENVQKWGYTFLQTLAHFKKQ